MKKLLNCSATYDYNNLISYQTPVFQRKGNILFLYCYRSHTTLSHIRKFADVIEKIHPDYATIIRMMYRYNITNKKMACVYNMETGEIISDNDEMKMTNIFMELTRG